MDRCAWQDHKVDLRHQCDCTSVRYVPAAALLCIHIDGTEHPLAMAIPTCSAPVILAFVCKVRLVDVDDVSGSTNRPGMKHHIQAHHLPEPQVIGQHCCTTHSSLHLEPRQVGHLFTTDEVVENLKAFVQFHLLVIPEGPFADGTLASTEPATPNIAISGMWILDVIAPIL